MFRGAESFNRDISGWRVDNVTDMGWMFWGAGAFNQPIGDWQVHNVRTMGAMFAATAITEQYHTANKGYRTRVIGFENYAFNQPIGGWDTSNVTDMGAMFKGASAFNQDLSKWQITVQWMSSLPLGSSFPFEEK